MQFTYLLSAALALVPAVLAGPAASTVTLTYSGFYDNGLNLINGVACASVFTPKGYTNLKSLPAWPYVGAAPSVTGSGDADCGSCWKVTYTNPQGQSKSIHVAAIDNGNGKYIVGKKVMDELTGGQALNLGSVKVTQQKVARSICGF